MARRTEGRIAPIAVALLLAVTGCTTVQQIRDSGRAGEYEISCGYFGWYICYQKADELCRGGYKVIAESEEHFGGRKTRISCQAAK